MCGEMRCGEGATLNGQNLFDMTYVAILDGSILGTPCVDLTRSGMYILYVVL